MTPEIQLATVPMDPGWLPEFALLLGGLAGIVVALNSLFAKQPKKTLKAAAASLACFALTFALAKTHRPPRSPALLPAERGSVSLVLGDVLLQVIPSDQYVLSMGGKQFCVLNLRRSRLRVTGVMGADDRVLAVVRENTFPYRRSAAVRPARDAHTLWVEEEGREIFRIRYEEPRRIELAGQFFESTSDRFPLLSCREGIQWTGGSVPRGTTIDLRKEGAGAIDFELSGAIHVLPRDAAKARAYVSR
jgi:hypothetical protein